MELKNKGKGKKRGDTTMTHNLDRYTVYDNRTDKVVACGTYAEVEDYVECAGKYTVVHDYSGQVVSD